MECEEVRQRLKDFIDDDLENPERTAIRGHLESCPKCAGSARQLGRLHDVLQAWKTADPPPDLYERLIAGFESRESWWRKFLAPAYAGRAALRLAEVAAVAIITLAVSGQFRKPKPAQPEDDFATINFYMTEHREAVLQAASAEFPGRQPVRMSLSRGDIMYYEYIDDDRHISRPGMILRGAGAVRDPGMVPPAFDLPEAKTLTLPQARAAVSFEPVAPSRIHPGYILDTITKVAGRESLHLLYTNGVETLSVFEQPLGGDQPLAAEDFRKYAVYKSFTPAEGSGNQAGTTILAWKNTHVSFVLIGRADMSRLMEMAQAFTDAGRGVNEFGE